MPDRPTRLEHDLLGEKAVPADAYYGVQTARGLENFPSPAFSSSCIPI
jgi:aspartate ammonia-lyase